MLTAGDVEQKTFSTALRGYDLDEVDDFLDEVVSTLRHLNEEIEAARKGVPVTDTEPAPPSPMAEAPAAPIDESAIGRALLAAQNAADQLLTEARDEAVRIVASAQSEADTWQTDREAKRAEAEAELASLSNRIAAIRSELAVLAGQVADKLDEMDALVSGGTPPGDVAEQPELGIDQDEETSEGSHTVDPEDSPDGATVYELEPEPSGDDQAGGGSDHLDEILTGVVTDLRLGADTEEEEDEDE